MTRRLAVLVVCLTFAAPAVAQRDRGKELIPRLLAGPSAVAAASTVRILSDGREAALGTVVSTDGLILTKGSELRGDLMVKFRGSDALYDAKLIGYHRASDLALIKVDAKDVKFKPVQFTTGPGTVGGWVACPGVADEPVAVGVLSAAERKLDPRLDEGLTENRNKGYLGITFGADEDGAVRVGNINSHSKAAGKLRPGDIILEAAGKTIERLDNLPDALDNHKPGDTVTIKVRRGEDELAVRVTLVPRSSIDRSDFQNTLGNNQLSGRRTGFPAVLQHDSQLKPTDCGGPLVDLDGRVLGLNIARAGRVETWALPTDVISPILDGLKAGKYQPVSKK